MADRPQGHQVADGVEGGEQPVGTGVAPAREPSHAERCRTLVASAARGALTTVAIEPEGYPYGSVANYAVDEAGNPLFLVSLMAEHTQNARRDPRAGLLVTEPVPEGADPLAVGRVSLLGLMTPVADSEVPEVRERFLAANPTAAYYADFGDFNYYRLEVEHLRYVGGYGRMSWVDAGEYARAEPDPVAPVAARIIGHMNEDHADSLVVFCHHYLGRGDVSEATMSAVDRYGFDMVGVTPSGRLTLRLAFPAECRSAQDVREAMVELVRGAEGG